VLVVLLRALPRSPVICRGRPGLDGDAVGPHHGQRSSANERATGAHGAGLPLGDHARRMAASALTMVWTSKKSARPSPMPKTSMTCAAAPPSPQQVAKNLFLWRAAASSRKALGIDAGAMDRPGAVEAAGAGKIYLNIAEWGPNGDSASRPAAAAPSANQP